MSQLKLVFNRQKKLVGQEIILLNSSFYPYTWCLQFVPVKN